MPQAPRTSDTSQPAPRIRPAAARDVPQLGDLGVLMVESHHVFDPDRFLAATAATRRAYASFLASQIDNGDAIVLVAEDRNQLVGYAYAAIEGYDYMALRGPAAVLHDLLVVPEYRGRGVARLLLNAVLDRLRARGVPRIVLFTAERNERAQRLFSAAGFRKTMIEMTREID